MSKPKVLVVDDEPDILMSIQFCLEQEGYEVLTAADGGKALNTVRQIEPDLIVLDVMMPKENGYRVAHRIREAEKYGKFTKRIPIILLTARNLAADPEREQHFMDFSGADLMMYKPFEMDELLARIRGLLETHPSNVTYA
jgi:DNA-binding response OmpR family regulator